MLNQLFWTVVFLPWYFWDPSGIKWQGVAASDIKWLVKKGGEKRTNLCRGKHEIFAPQCCHTEFSTTADLKFEIKKNRVVKIFQIFTADYYKSLNFKGICLAQVNPVLNPIQVHFPMKILSPIVSWKIEKVKRTYQSKSIQTKSLSFKIVEKKSL